MKKARWFQLSPNLFLRFDGQADGDDQGLVYGAGGVLSAVSLTTLESAERMALQGRYTEVDSPFQVEVAELNALANSLYDRPQFTLATRSIIRQAAALLE